jgi:hypothetical protein
VRFSESNEEFIITEVRDKVETTTSKPDSKPNYATTSIQHSKYDLKTPSTQTEEDDETGAKILRPSYLNPDGEKVFDLSPVEPTESCW